MQAISRFYCLSDGCAAIAFCGQNRCSGFITLRAVGIRAQTATATYRDMQFQLVINMQRASAREDMRDVARHALDMVEMADASGFESVWAAEHHGVELYIAPNPFQLLTWWAAHTSRIRLGVGVAVAPFWHPLKLAEEAAMLDVLSGGRLELGIGSGAMQREFDRICPGLAQAQGYRYVQEALPAVKALWTGDYAHVGELWSFPQTTSVPQPVQTPHPPLWVAARSPLTFDFAIKHGCHVMTWAMNRPFSEVETYKQRFDHALANHPGTTRPLFATMRYTAVVEHSRELECAVAAVHRQVAGLEVLRNERGEVRNGFPVAPDPRDVAARAEFAPEVLARHLMFGTPDEIITKLKRYQQLGVDRFIYCASFGLDAASQTRSLALFIDEVMPAFSGVAAPAPGPARRNAARR